MKPGSKHLNDSAAKVRSSPQRHPGWAKKLGDPDQLASDGSSDAWEAVLRRDRLSDGKLVYGATTTGIYCRPSCPARHPHAHNTLLFHTAEEAEHEGYTPCSRCCPDSKSLTHAEACIKAVIEYIEKHYNQCITLKILSHYTGLSANHLQQTFLRIVGLSPKALCDAVRLAHFKLRLRAGDSISEAGYAVGYGSSRAIYEDAKRTLGMTPATFRRGGERMNIRYTILDGDLARVLVATTKSGICSVLLGEEEPLIRELREEFSKAILSRDEMPSSKINLAIASCRKEDPLLSKLPLPMRRQVFLARASMALLRVL
jgi:AraC family transcriptional regulator of adaptative response/methylated-DNA-[protein]-cysteine methyltransferase